MVGQVALLIELSSAATRHVPLDDTAHYVGALDAIVDHAQLFPGDLAALSPSELFVLGVGPLGGTAIPGCNHLALATVSPLSNAPQLCTLAGAGLIVDALGRSPIVLHGQARDPSALLIRQQGNSLEIQLTPLDAVSKDGAGDEISALEALLLERFGTADDMALLLTGPAARATSFGSLLVAQLRDGTASPPLDATTRGGLGSALWQRHRLGAICFASDRPAGKLVRRGIDEGRIAQHFHPAMSRNELERATNCTIDSRLFDGGTALQQLEASGSELLCFNATSIYYSPEQRVDFYERVVRSHLVGKLKLSLTEHAARHLDCGAPCPLACRKISADTLRDFEPHALLGPQLGVFERSALDPLVRRCMELGVDVTSASSIIGWLMERLAREELAPAAVGLSQLPRWSHVDFDAEADSRSNAVLALALLDGLLHAEWAAPLRRGLRPTCQASATGATDWAFLLELGDTGEVAPAPIWSLGNLAPSPLPGGPFSYQGRHFLPPRELGRACARRLAAQLALANHGLCGQHRGWLEQHYPALLCELYGWRDDWLAHHARLARRLVRSADIRFWSTGRTIDFVEQRLRHHQMDGAADATLDTWVRRFALGSAAAARAFWSEARTGLAQELTA